MKRSDVLLSSRFTLPGRFLLSSRVQLYSNRVEFRGRELTRSHRKTIAIGDITDVTWFTTPRGEPNLRIQLRTGSEVLVRVRQAGLWCFELRRLARLEQGRAEIPVARSARVADAA